MRRLIPAGTGFACYRHVRIRRTSRRRCCRKRAMTSASWYEEHRVVFAPMDVALELEAARLRRAPGAVPSEPMARLTDAYTTAVASAAGDDVRVGSGTATP